MLSTYEDVMRRAVRAHHGFESIAPGAGQIRFAFHKPEDALRFCMQVRRAKNRGENQKLNSPVVA
eukprot:1393159-Pyramimonas_sp.AAC.1